MEGTIKDLGEEEEWLVRIYLRLCIRHQPQMNIAASIHLWESYLTSDLIKFSLWAFPDWRLLNKDISSTPS